MKFTESKTNNNNNSKNIIKEDELDNDKEFLIGFILGYFLNIFAIIHNYFKPCKSVQRKKGIFFGFRVMVFFICIIIIIFNSIYLLKLKVENNVYEDKFGPVTYDKQKHKYKMKYTRRQLRQIKERKLKLNSKILNRNNN